MTIFLLTIALLVSFFLLARIVDVFFVDALDKISHDLRLSSDAAGATLMAVGSSAPELFVALFSVLKPGEHQAIGVGSIVGSALFNLLVIVGAAATIKSSKLTWQPMIRDILFYFLTVAMLLWGLADGFFSMLDASLFVLLYIIYVTAVIFWRKILPYTDSGADFEENENESRFDKISRPADRLMEHIMPDKKHYHWIFLISVVLIATLSWILVDAAVAISEILNIPEAIIGLTVLAIGTSIPDLFSSLIVARQGRTNMAVSNAIGSNIFDILIGLGVPFIVYMLINGGTIAAGNGSLTYSVILLNGSVILLLALLLLSRWFLGKRIGWFLILLYTVYLISEIVKVV